MKCSQCPNKYADVHELHENVVTSRSMEMMTICDTKSFKIITVRFEMIGSRASSITLCPICSRFHGEGASTLMDFKSQMDFNL